MVAEDSPAAPPAEPPERQVMFKGPMVRAIIADEKTQTRRVMAPQPRQLARPQRPGQPAVWLHWSSRGAAAAGGFEWSAAEPCRWPTPYGQAGDRLWVRESAWIAPAGAVPPRECNATDAQGRPRLVLYVADSLDGRNAIAEERRLRKVPAMLFPRWACRLRLDLVQVRVQRLQNITDAEIRAEGVTREAAAQLAGVELDQVEDLQDAWATGWDAINGRRPGCRYDANPFVWVLEFKRLTP